MKKALLLIVAVLSGCAVLNAAPLPQVKLIHSGVICDTIVDALAPGSMVIDANGDYLLTFQDQGDNSPSAKTYLVRSKDHGKTWSKPEVIMIPEHGKQGASAGICNIPGSTDLMLIVCKIDYDSDTLNQFAWKTRIGKLELYRTTDGKDRELVATLRQPKDAMASPMGCLTRLANGDLVLPAYIYNYGTNRVPGEIYGSGWYRSTDNGKTWGDFELVFKDQPPAGERPYLFTESAFVSRPDGLIVGVARHDTRKPKMQYRVFSSDFGKTWTLPEKTDHPCVDIPLITKLEDDKGYLMVGGNCGIYLRTVTFFWSKDGISWQKISEAFYQPDNRHTPMNSATGGCQSLVKGPGKHQYFVAFYAHDPKLPGRHKTRIEGNMVELVFPEK